MDTRWAASSSNLAERRRARAGVLLAPLPPTGVFPFLLRLLRSDPVAVAKVLMTMSCRPVVGDAERAARLFLTGTTTRTEVNRLFSALGDESFRVFLELLQPNLDPSQVQVRLAVLGASADAIFTATEIEATARAYGTEPVMFAGMGHDVMLDPAWTSVADWLIGWCAPFATTPDTELTRRR